MSRVRIRRRQKGFFSVIPRLDGSRVYDKRHSRYVFLKNDSLFVILIQMWFGTDSNPDR